MNQKQYISNTINSITKEFDIANQYNKILKDILYTRPAMKKYLSKDKKSSCNDTLLHNLNIAIKKMTNLILETIVIREALFYELEQYKQKTTLSDIEKKDKDCIWSWIRQIGNLKDSYFHQLHFINKIKEQCEIYPFSKTSSVPKAVAHECRKILDRYKNNSILIIKEYMPVTMIKPYYFYLQKQGISFLDDINKKLPTDIITSYDEIKEKLKPYIQKIAECTKNDISYKKVRQENWQAYLNKKEAKQTEIQKQKEQSKQQQYKERLHKHVIKRQEAHNKRRLEGKEYNIPTTSFTNAENYNPNSKSCCYICALCKPEKGNSYFAYLTSKGLTTKEKDVDIFMFDNDEMESVLKSCKMLKDVKEVETIFLY